MYVMMNLRCYVLSKQRMSSCGAFHPGKSCGLWHKQPDPGGTEQRGRSEPWRWACGTDGARSSGRASSCSNGRGHEAPALQAALGWGAPS